MQLFGYCLKSFTVLIAIGFQTLFLLKQFQKVRSIMYDQPMKDYEP